MKTMNIIIRTHQPNPAYNSHYLTLYRQRRAALTAGRAGQLYSLMGKIRHPEDSQKARRWYEEKLDEELAMHARRIFIDGTAMPRVLPEQDDFFP
ncbi:hypothetical protein SAMN05518669_13511 [Variovorax sp. YR634]|nr:hypothetical protein SAMN05518669_13511 [Variovorax sp. YR634]